MGSIIRFLGNPGSRPSVSQRAPIAGSLTEVEIPTKKAEDGGLTILDNSSDEISESEMGHVDVREEGAILTTHGFTGLQKDFGDRVLDKLVMFAGTQFIFFIMWAIIIVWIVLGIVYKAPDNWQVVMQDGQSLQSYFWDTLLMRQQLTSAHDHTNVCAVLRSRIRTFKKFGLSPAAQLAREKSQEDVQATSYEVQGALKDGKGELVVESWYDRLSTLASKLIGSLPAILIFWGGIFAWVGCGALPLATGNNPPFSSSNPEYKKFSDLWQLCINTATAVPLLICTMFLQNIRARHEKYITKLLAAVFDIDTEIEEHLRTVNGDFTTPNEIVTIPARDRSVFEKVIDVYADIIGTGVGLVIAIGAIAAWLAIGNVMSWSSNWWLIIGTYTGLIGFLDGSVLRQVYFRIVNQEEENYALMAQEDADLFEALGLHCPDELFVDHKKAKSSFSLKISNAINRACSSQLCVLASISTIIGLIIVASALRWSTTGQLICNTPTMIIEEFFLIVLIQAHNWADKRRRIDVSTLYARRCLLRSHLKGANN
ncbi:LAME_0C00562g1_1 [Lachancea meyersii CBS 8951]|uniref:LAME_0C00562g1_1 n=1 Tax=Lachancea meyersii CBS 8951 TaxID=1266667 RepID=A0A1G4IZA2_9SACH|nr:LAME_0C00562g1_1 [Lachancea meyersii CBS 8951]